VLSNFSNKKTRFAITSVLSITEFSVLICSFVITSFDCIALRERIDQDQIYSNLTSQTVSDFRAKELQFSTEFANIDFKSFKKPNINSQTSR